MKDKKVVIAFFVKLIITAAVAYILLFFVFGIAHVKGESMYPRLRDGDYVLYYRIGNEYAIGDIVAFEIEGTRRFARIAALPGDEVDLTEDGQLIVNGNIQQEEVHYPTYALDGGISYPYTVESSSVFLLCDFRTQSSDSRSYGAVSLDSIEGKVISLLRVRGL